MEPAVVESDGRIRLPKELQDAAGLRPGQELPVNFARGWFALLIAELEDSTEYNEEFMEETLQALHDSEGSVFHASSEEFLQALEERAGEGSR